MRSRISESDDREQEYFKKALSDFALDAASGGAIRHLADRGYTANQIVRMLDFPTPFKRVQQTVWKYFLDQGIILLEEPERERGQAEYDYVTEYDAYGRKSFRRVVTKEPSPEPVVWRESRFCQAAKGERLPDFLERKSRENGEGFSYVSCDFGLYKRRDPKGFERLMDVLEPEDREYIGGICWERKMAYHRLNQRMRRIAARLGKAGHPEVCYFIKSREKVRL